MAKMTLREALIDIRKRRKRKGIKPLPKSVLSHLSPDARSRTGLDAYPIPQTVRSRTGKDYSFEEIVAEWDSLMNEEAKAERVTT